MPRARDLRSADYRALADFRYQLRLFLSRREQAARAAGISIQQYQVLLWLKALEDRAPASIGALAERLQIRHNAAVGLIDRLVARGLAQRRRATSDRRQVLLELTRPGEVKLRQLALYSLTELQEEAPAIVRVLTTLVRSARRLSARRRARRAVAAAARPTGTSSAT